jgi:hypothetical protein
MKALPIVLLIALLAVIGCSKESGASGSSKNLVPATGAKVMASPDFKLEHTTKSGIKCYVRPLTPEVGRTITPDNRDHQFLQGDEKSYFYLLVPIRDGKIMDGEAAEVSMTDGTEIMSFTAKRDSEAAKTPK